MKPFFSIVLSLMLMSVGNITAEKTADMSSEAGTVLQALSPHKSSLYPVTIESIELLQPDPQESSAPQKSDPDIWLNQQTQGALFALLMVFLWNAFEYLLPMETSDAITISKMAGTNGYHTPTLSDIDLKPLSTAVKQPLARVYKSLKWD